MHKINYKKLCKNNVNFRWVVEKNRNIEHFFWMAQEKNSKKCSQFKFEVL